MKGGTVLSTGTTRHGQAARKFRRRYGRVCNGENSLKFHRYTEVDGETQKDCGGATIYHVLPDDMQAVPQQEIAAHSVTLILPQESSAALGVATYQKPSLECVAAQADGHTRFH